MRLTIAFIAALHLGACAPDWTRRPGLPGTYAHYDDGTIAGSWQIERRDGGAVRGVELSILGGGVATFAIQSGCTMTGGVLVATAANDYRIDRYESGFSTDRCGPWKNGPAVAPFDGASVNVARNGSMLTVTGGGHVAIFRRMSV